MTILYIFLGILLLGILITIHEFGHFMSARMLGIPVKEFAIGFGPHLFQWKSKKHDTLFSLRPIPFGGYCMYYGDTDDDPTGESADDPRNFNRACVWRRMLCVFSGPLMNFVLAFVVAVALMAAYGLTLTRPYIIDIEENMPAAAAGLQPGDVFLQVADVSPETGGVAAVIEAISADQNGSPIPILVERNGQEEAVQLTPVWDEDAETYRIGIMLSAVRPLYAGEIVPAAWRSCVFASHAILDALGKMVTTGEGLQDAAGPIGVVQLVAEQTRQGGLEIFLNLMVMISINLGLMNLLPIPGLDGSRIIFMALEAIRRKPISQRIESAVHLSGYALLLGLMLFFTFRDVGRIFG